MWPFKRNQVTEIADEPSAMTYEEAVQIPKEKFTMEDNPASLFGELPIYEIYKRLQEDWETKGYKDAVSFPETTYRDHQKQVIVDQLRLAIKEALLRYEDKLVDIDMAFNQAQKCGLMETAERYQQEKKKLLAHHDELSSLDKDAEEIGTKTKPILTSYEMGFTRGMVLLSNEKVSEIMAK